MVLGFPGPDAGSKFETKLENLENLENIFLNGFGLPRPGSRSKFEADLENLENVENLENLFSFMVLGFPRPEAGASLKQTWKIWKTWKTICFHGFGFPKPGGRSKFETDLENLENLENLFVSWF